MLRAGIIPSREYNNFFRNETVAITLDEDTKRQLQASLQRYCAQNFDEDVGGLKAAMLLDFCVREIGPSIYNQAIKDAQAEMRDRIDALDVTCYQEEFAYWRKPSRQR
jgi:uncharacterized protein (DUF2164 family)